MIDKTPPVTQNILPPWPGAPIEGKEGPAPVLKPNQVPDSFEQSLAFAVKPFEFTPKKETPKAPAPQGPDVILPSLLRGAAQKTPGIETPPLPSAGDPPAPGHVQYMTMLTPDAPGKRPPDTAGEKTDAPRLEINRHVLGIRIALAIGAGVLAGAVLWGIVQLINAGVI